MAAHHETQPDGTIVRTSALSVQATMDKLEQAAQEKGMTVFARIDHAAGAAKADLALRPTQLLLFGNPQGGTPLMQSAQTAGLDLPLKLLVMEQADGQVAVIYNDPAWLAQRHGIDDRTALLERISGLLTALVETATR